MAKRPIFAAVAFMIAAYSCSGQKYVLLDSRFVKPLQFSETFSEADIFSRRFPVYQEDVPEIVRQTVALARSIEKRSFLDEYIDTLFAGHSIIIAKAARDDGKMATSVYIKTMLPGMNVMVDLVEKKQEKRVVQLKLLAFTDYLTARPLAPPNGTK